jgi:hypothetical protein
MFLKFEKGNFLESGNATQPLEVARARSVKERCALFNTLQIKCALFWSENTKCVKNARGICSARMKNYAVWL